ncbi:glycosyltransferase [Georgenia sp. SYP-B2076]|uniref:glycosyltransferase n=1 Tax=Georgenia sp. SYP-B2076 TaxID=2495881 RepID=UPI000F8E7FD5|nr:glycosyltransferase [Georgenia sp. SYP-B2076]
MRTVAVETSPLAALAAELDEVAARRLEAGAQRARALLRDRVVWNISATDGGGGVAELLRTLLPYVRDAGVDTRWLVLDGDADFFALATRLHLVLHGDPGDGGELGPEEMAHYDRVLAANLAEVRDVVSPGDVVILHDPATAGLVPGLKSRGAIVLWRSHIGTDAADGVADRAWAFLEPSLDRVDRVILTRATYRPGFLDEGLVRVIAPSVDPLSPKNRHLDAATVTSLLRSCGALAGGADAGPTGDTQDAGDPATGETGGPSSQRAGGPVPADARVVLQVSRWDRLKDMTGVLIAFDEGFDQVPPDVHLVLAGAEARAEDRAGTEVLEQCLQMWHGLEGDVRARVHVVCLPADDVAHNALLVNALQRYATVVVQKSLVEGFGLTVAESLWKGRPVVATAVGGILDQIEDGTNGLLVPDPRDLEGLMTRVCRLLAEPGFAAQLGATAQARVRREFLSDRHLLQYVDVLEELL